MQLFGVALLCLSFGGLMAYEGGSKWLDGRRLDQHGLLAEARIVGRRTMSSSKDRSRSYWVRVNFVPKDGERLNTEIEVSEGYMEEHQDPTSSRVMVRYLHDDPTIAVIEGERLFFWSAPIGLFVVMAGMVMGAIGIRRFSKEPVWEHPSL